MPGDDSETEEGGPVATYQSYIAEGDILAKQGEFRKSIEAYSKVLYYLIELMGLVDLMRSTDRPCDSNQGTRTDSSPAPNATSS